MSTENPSLSGSEVMYPPLASNSAATHPLVAAQPSPAYAMPGMGGYLPGGPEILSEGLNQTWLVNCLRRRWLLALLMGMLIGAATAVVLLLVFPLSSSVTALLQVKSKPPTVLKDVKPSNYRDFEIFSATQLSMIRSQLVLAAALSRPDIAQLDSVVKEDDPVLWLSEELLVSYPTQGEILAITFQGEEDSEEIAKIIDAVIAAYKGDVLHAERTQLSATREDLSGMHREIKRELEKMMQKYEDLAEELGGADSSTAGSEVNLLMNQIGMARKDLAEQKEGLLELEVNMRLANLAARSPSAIDAAIGAELEADPTVANYRQDQYMIDQRIRELQSNTKRPTPELKRLRQTSQQVAQELQQYQIQKEAELRRQLKNAPNEQLSQTIAEYMMRRTNHEQTIAVLEESLEDMYEEIRDKGKSSTALDILRLQIEEQQEMERDMSLRLRSWKVEEDAAQERIRVIQNATATEDINVWERFGIAGMGGLLAFCVTCYCVAFIEFRRRRLNGPSDLDEGLGIRVLGVLPSVASNKASAPGSMLGAQLSESIDNVRATIMHDSTSRPRQVVLVTSPVTMEGTTTVASHLALSLTRAGRRTLLIDGDLREPALHKLFGLPLEDGFCEVLRSEVDLDDAIRPTNTEGLWLLTSGQCDMDSVHALATDQPQPIFEKLRAEFDFIIIDGAPVLSLSDTVSIGQYVDGAVLTVLRDHSEVRKIYQAAELLKEMGIRLIGSVVSGMPQKADRRVTRLHSAEARRARQIEAQADL